MIAAEMPETFDVRPYVCAGLQNMYINSKYLKSERGQKCRECREYH